MGIEVLPLPKKFFDRAVELGISHLILSFSGGSDEGYLDVNYKMLNDLPLGKETNELANEVNVWAEEAYEYSGAGDGSPYGDHVTYDLANKTVEVSEWFTTVVNGETGNHALVIDENEDEE
jgi:hypothetical protein